MTNQLPIDFWEISYPNSSKDMLFCMARADRGAANIFDVNLSINFIHSAVQGVLRRGIPSNWTQFKFGKMFTFLHFTMGLGASPQIGINHTA